MDLPFDRGVFFRHAGPDLTGVPSKGQEKMSPHESFPKLLTANVMTHGLAAVVTAGTPVCILLAELQPL